MARLVIIGPTSLPWSDIAADVADDLRALRRPGVDIDYVTTGAGPTRVHTEDDERDAAPPVIATALRVASDYDAIIVDCTSDPGVADARRHLDVPIVGAGEAMRWAADRAPTPALVLTGEELRTSRPEELERRTAGAATVVIAATGHRAVVETLRAAHPTRTVVEPLEAAVDWCFAMANE